MSKRGYTYIKGLVSVIQAMVAGIGNSPKGLPRRAGQPYDNAMDESFFSILKTKYIYRHDPKTFRETNELIGR